MNRIGLNKIITQLLKEHHLLSAPEMLEILEKQGLKYNKTSLYRALDKLFINQKVCRHLMGSNQVLYALRNTNQVNLVCQCCGKVQLSKNSDKADLTKYASENFTPDHQHITVFGRCHNCDHDKKPKKLITLHLS